MKKVAILTVTLVAATGAVCCCLAGEHRADDRIRVEHDRIRVEHDRIRVEHDADAFVTTIRIRAEDGRVAWSDVLRALARARGNDDTALQGIGRQGRFPIAGPMWLAVSVPINLALQPNVSFAVERASVVQGKEDSDGQPWLVIKLDREALLASKNRFTARLRNVWLFRRPSKKDYGLALDDAWEKAPADQNLVVVVHGLDSSPEKVKTLLDAIRGEGLPCAAFRYPNDQPIAESAKLLSADLAEFAKDHPGRGVSLVTSSMGGLVARAAIEDPQLDPGNVRQLIMVAPPNHGSALARFGFGLDVWEHVADVVRKKEVRVFYGLVEDGLSEAAADLRPGSPFLRKLNARDRNPKVRYTIFLGTGGPLSRAELELMRKSIADAGDRSRWVRFFGTRAHTWLEDFDEVVKGKGDGAVSVERGRLEGVEDTVLLEFRHVRVLPARRLDDDSRLYPEVLKRLRVPEGL